MNRIYVACICLLLMCGLSALTVSKTSGGFAAPLQKQSTNKGDLNLLSMEVQALETLYNFKATVPQLQRIARVAKITKAKMEKLEPAKASADYAKALKDLRLALIANDEDAIEKCLDELGKVEEKSPPELDNEFDITDAARKEVDGLYMTLSLRQLVLYAESFGDDLPDPAQVILEGVGEIRMLKGKEWEEVRDDIAQEVSWLVGGLGGSKADKIRNDVKAFLNRQHDKNSQAAELMPQIRQIIGPLDALTLLRNYLKHDLALLLSNPRLEQAVQARLTSKR